MSSKKPKPWKWTARAMREAPKADSEIVTLSPVGSDYNGRMLWALEGHEGTPCMTAPEWRNFCLVMMGESPIRAEHDDE